ncbi:glycoside hydrolase family 2 protein [Cohnella fermenti]|uniref:Glycoside hydrolase family 2 n=1 Tax=Cohnella fermenti TaxID=2565925 RepID=A0A4S4BQT5_9BACL|nr:sugar-binding domain-containing protein [Cohnella fermenti]THF77322.1 glycoside hydrolase family 2 [Cohnella fermenti]
MSEQPRQEHPRPQFVRDSWVNLNGEWEFAFDDGNAGDEERWQLGDKPLPLRIQVPFAFQSKLSGIADPDIHDTVWYRRSFDVPAEFANKRILLHFGAVDYEASVWVNGQLAARHEGGHTPFKADITRLLNKNGNVLVVKAVDCSRDRTLPRGKQYWKPKSAGVYYTRTTGIWQTVWMEAVSSVHLDRVKLTPNLDAKQVEIQAFVQGELEGRDLRLHASISFGGKSVAEDSYSVRHEQEKRIVTLRDGNERAPGLEGLWSPDTPNLYDIAFRLYDGQELLDEVKSYFGMRKISVENGRFYLNNRPCFSKMVLDQGYFPDGNLTPPSDEAIRRDVELTKEMGFNGARKHQKLEDPRYLYWCDRLGLLVWSEAANAMEFSDANVRRFANEWIESVERDYNHPCVAVWVPLNESWGASDIRCDGRQEAHAMSLYYLTKSLDSSRPVVSNDGWELVKTDLFTIHDYGWNEELLTERYRSAAKAVSALPAGMNLYVDGYPYEGQPILVTEMGGIAYRTSEQEGWGYSGASDDADYESRLRAVIRPYHAADTVVQGYCFTQLTDVEQEINGLLTYDRKPKIQLEIIRSINEGN